MRRELSGGGDEREDETFLDNPLLSGVMFFAVAAAVAAPVTGLVAAIRHRDRAVPVLVATLVGLFVVWVVIGVVVSGG